MTQTNTYEGIAARVLTVLYLRMKYPPHSSLIRRVS